MKLKFLAIASLALSTVTAPAKTSHDIAKPSGSCLERASKTELLAEVSRRMSGDGGGDSILVDSTVDLQCVSTLARNHPYQPDVALLASWASQCRTNADESRCVLISNSANSACFSDLSRRYPYQLSDSETAQLTSACQSRRYSCRSF